MLKAIRFSLLFILIVLQMLSSNASNIDTTNNYVSSDSIKPIKKYFFDNDSICYAIIDSSRIVRSTIIEDSLKSKYISESFNWIEPRIINKESTHFNKIKIRKQPSIWVFYILLSIVIYFTFIRNIFYKSLPIIFQAYWNDRSINQFTRDDNFFKSRNSIFYFVLFSMVYATLVYFIIDYFGYSMPRKGLELYYLIITVFTIFYTAKYLLMKLIGYIFSVQRVISGYLAIISVSNLVFTVLSIPFLIFFHYINADYKIYILSIILVSFIFNTVYKYLRTGAFLKNNFQFPIFYLFLYLCAFEIMPLLIIYKVFVA
jgi:hypothetical protein